MASRLKKVLFSEVRIAKSSALASFLGLLVLWGGFGTFGFISLGEPFFKSFLVSFLSLPVLFSLGWSLVFFPIVFIHEGGHWLFGRLAGLELYEFSVWPFVWRRVPEKEFHWAWGKGIPKLPGYVFLFTPEGRFDARGRAWMLVGPMITGGLYDALLLLLSVKVSPIFYLPAITGSFVTLSSIVPEKSKGVWRTDGRQLYDLWRDVKKEQAAQAFNEIAYLANRGAKEVPVEAFEAALSHPVNAAHRVWILAQGFYYVKGKERRRWLCDTMEDPATVHIQNAWPWIVAADCALMELADLELARRLLPQEESLEAIALKPFLLTLACIQAAEGCPTSQDSWERARAASMENREVAEQITAYHRVWFETQGPLWPECRQLFRMWADGVRPREWDLAAIRWLGEFEGGLSAVAFGLTVRYYHFLDAGLVREAVDEIERAMRVAESDPGVNRQLLDRVRAEGAYTSAVFGRDVEAAKRRLEGCEGMDDVDAIRLRAQAAVAVLEDKSGEASYLLKLAESRCIDRSDRTDRYRFDEGAIQRVRAMMSRP